MAIQLPVLSAIFMALRALLWPVLRGLWFLVKHKLWFLVSLVFIFLGPLEFIGDFILQVLTQLVPALQSFAGVARSVDLTGWQGALAAVGEGASLANCVIDLNAFIRVAAILWVVMCAQVSFVTLRFLYTMIPGKAT